MNDQKGFVMVISLLILLGISILGISMVTNANMSSTIASNYKNKLQSFYASDGQITLLSQEVIDSNQCQYITNTPSCPCANNTNLIQNGNFNNGGNNWRTSYVNGGSGGGLAIVDGQGKMQIDNSGNATYSVQLFQHLTFVPGKKYTFSFDISATEAPKSFKILIESEDGNYTSYFSQIYSTNAVGPSNSQHFTQNWTQPLNSVSSCKFGIHLGTFNDKDVFIDNVIVSEATSASSGDTVMVDSYKVIRSIIETEEKCFSINTDSYLQGKLKSNSFHTPLSQYIELKSGGLINPYGTTCTVPVIFYDFRTDRTNPEFEAPNHGDVYHNMVSTFLGGDKKPILGNNPHRNYYIKYWFSDWNTNGAKGDNTIPYYKNLPGYHGNPPGGGNWDDENFFPDDQWLVGASYYNQLKTKNVGHDTSFKNVVVQDSLVFTQVSGSEYQYTNYSFYPLDGKGFEANGGVRDWNVAKDVNSCKWKGPANHNYGFTMEIHRTFIKIPGLTFEFKGDDDVWLFIDNKLAMDLGGCHDITTNSVNIDALGLNDGQEYSFDFFYCERHSSSSDIQVTTNMLIYVPINTSQRNWKRNYGNLD